jgi:hypothetical protein
MVHSLPPTPPPVQARRARSMAKSAPLTARPGPARHLKGADGGCRNGNREGGMARLQSEWRRDEAEPDCIAPMAKPPSIKADPIARRAQAAFPAQQLEWFVLIEATPRLSGLRTPTRMAGLRLRDPYRDGVPSILGPQLPRRPISPHPPDHRESDFLLRSPASVVGSRGALNSPHFIMSHAQCACPRDSPILSVAAQSSHLPSMTPIAGEGTAAATPPSTCIDASPRFPPPCRSALLTCVAVPSPAPLVGASSGQRPRSGSFPHAGGWRHPAVPRPHI